MIVSAWQRNSAATAKVITRLTLMGTPPQQQMMNNYIPTSIVFPVQLTLTANREAAGAAVTLSTTLGTIGGLTNATLTLGGDGINDATASAYLEPDSTKQDTAVVTALSTAPTTPTYAVNMFGPPTLVPAMANLTAGATTHVSVATLADLRSVRGCRATPAAGMTISSAGSDLTTGAVVAVKDVDNDGQADISIDVAVVDGGAGAATTIDCFDV